MGRAGVDGLKTGTTSQAGQTMITTAVQDNMRVISVILHADQSDTDERARFVETNRLLDYCFNSYALEKLVAQNQVLPERDRKSTRLNSSHANISYAVFCLKKK